MVRMTTQTDAFAHAWQLHQAGDHRRAEEGYRRILRSEPRSARAWYALAHLCAAGKRLTEAAAYFRQALELAPHEAQGYYDLGNVLVQDGKLAEAVSAYRRCLQLKADHAEALVNLGYVLGEQNQAAEAKECYTRAVQLRPDLAEVHHNLGNLLRDQGQPEEALVCYDQALRLRPDYAKAHINRGIALISLARIDEAVRSLERGVELDPDRAEAHTSLAGALSVQHRFDEALTHNARALALSPGYLEAEWNRSLIWLQQGDYERGWPAYEARWRCKSTAPLPAFKQPRWDGAPLDGKTILLYAEQGIGDTLHMIRYAPQVKARGAGRVVVQCQNALVPLLARSRGIDQVVGWGSPAPSFDVYTPLLSLPGLFHTTLATVPAAVPYVFPDPELVAQWRRELAAGSGDPRRAPGGVRVGIAWQGSPRYAWDRHRSVRLEQFEALARIERVQLISLQKGPGSEQLRDLAGRFPVVDLGDRLDETAGPFMDTAAVVANLDLVVSVDSAIAHLAGAMGVPVWVALNYSPHWCWLLDRDNSPWYPTARLFRQTRLGDWDGVFARLAEALRERAAAGPRVRPIAIPVSPGELLDRIARLHVRSQHLTDPAELSRVTAQLAELDTLRQEAVPPAPHLDKWAAELQAVHERLGQIEDDLRACERAQDFGPRFVELARAAHAAEERRAALERSIDEWLGVAPARRTTA
jgi:tetratricopeptide (TPR) repeat protein